MANIATYCHAAARDCGRQTDSAHAGYTSALMRDAGRYYQTTAPVRTAGERYAFSVDSWERIQRAIGWRYNGRTSD